MPIHTKYREAILAFGVGAILLLIYHALFSTFFPSAENVIGHDYSYYLPHLLDGYYWYINNGISPVWFTPSFCGGVPALANPQNIFYSVPQWLTFLTNPLDAIYLTLLIFAGLGYAGFYLLLRQVFKLSIGTALLGATLFLFNGFYTTRVLIGHLSFHGFMLLPLIAFLLFYQPRLRPQYPLLFAIIPVTGCALLFSYFIYSAMYHLVIPIGLALLFIGIVHGMMFGYSRTFWVRLLAAGIMGIVISMPKLGASLAFLSYFERDTYLLPGAASIWGLITLIFEMLFLTPSPESAANTLTNLQWSMGRHELEFGITIIPFAILILGGTYIAYKTITGKQGTLSRSHWLSIFVLFVIFVIPMLVNYYHPDWNALLKEIPILKSSSSLIRWFCFYIPTIILLTALVLEKIELLPKLKSLISTIAIIGVVALVATTDRSYYSKQNYNSDTITNAYYQAKESQQSPPISLIYVSFNQEGRPVAPINRNDVLTKGFSQLFCYEAVFGYRLEKLPIEPLKLGKVNLLTGDIFNIKNPACYVYPEANNCKAGDHFTRGQASDVEAFIHRIPFDFAIPWWQELANTLAITLLFAIFALWIGYPAISYFKKRALSKQGDV